MVEKDLINESDYISSFGIGSFFIPLMSSTFLGMATYLILGISNIDSYISAILGTFIGIIPFMVYLYITKHSNHLDILDLNISLFGKAIGFILNFIIISVVFLLSVILLYNITHFLNIQYMRETQTNYLRIILLIPIVYAASKNIIQIAKVSQIFMFIHIGMFVITLLGLIPSLEINNIFPIMQHGMKPTIQSALLYVIFSTFPILLLTVIPQNKIAKEKHGTRNILLCYFIANFMITLMLLFTIGLLGEYIIPMFRYPEYIILKRFEMFSIIERVENILALQFIFSNILFQTVAFHFMAKGLKKVFKKISNKTLFPTLIAIAVLIFSNLIFKNTASSSSFFKDYLPYIILLGFFLPMGLTAIALVIKNIKKYFQIIQIASHSKEEQ